MTYRLSHPDDTSCINQYRALVTGFIHFDADRKSRQGSGEKRKNRQGEDDDTKLSAKLNADAGGNHHGNPKKGCRNKQFKRPETERHVLFSVPKPQDPCPFHNGLHVWGKCFENKHNTETPSMRRPAASGDQGPGLLLLLQGRKLIQRTMRTSFEVLNELLGTQFRLLRIMQLKSP